MRTFLPFAASAQRPFAVAASPTCGAQSSLTAVRHGKCLPAHTVESAKNYSTRPTKIVPRLDNQTCERFRSLTEMGTPCRSYPFGIFRKVGHSLLKEAHPLLGRIKAHPLELLNRDTQYVFIVPVCLLGRMCNRQRDYTAAGLPVFLSDPAHHDYAGMRIPNILFAKREPEAMDRPNSRNLGPRRHSSSVSQLLNVPVRRTPSPHHACCGDPHTTLPSAQPPQGQHKPSQVDDKQDQR